MRRAIGGGTSVLLALALLVATPLLARSQQDDPANDPPMDPAAPAHDDAAQPMPMPMPMPDPAHDDAAPPMPMPMPMPNTPATHPPATVPQHASTPPAAGTPAPGTSAPGTPAPGTPAPGAPAQAAPPGDNPRRLGRQFPTPVKPPTPSEPPGVHVTVVPSSEPSVGRNRLRNGGGGSDGGLAEDGDGGD
jgi:hypothetical protein